MSLHVSGRVFLFAMSETRRLAPLLLVILYLYDGYSRSGWPLFLNDVYDLSLALNPDHLGGDDGTVRSRAYSTPFAPL